MVLWYDRREHAIVVRRAKWNERSKEKGADWWPIPQDAALRLLETLLGRIVLPGDPDYNQDRRLSNPRFDDYPVAIVYCIGPSDVAAVLEVVRAYGIEFCVRSGGHSTAGFSACGGIILDTSEMNNVTVHPSGDYVTIEPGCPFAKTNATLESFGLHLQGGACPDVCQGGYMQGGGYGFTARIFGMHCDQVEAIEMMLYDGQIVIADENTNADLFWAVRGGTGNNFGVLLNSAYRPHQGDHFCGFSIRWSMDGDDNVIQTAKALTWLQEHFMHTASNQLGVQMIWAFEGPIGGEKTPCLLVRGMYKGSLTEMQAEIAPVLQVPGASLQYEYDQTLYSELNKVLLTQPYEVPEFPPGTKPFPPAENKLSRYIGDVLAPDQWKTLLDYFLTTPSPYTILAMEIYGGNISNKPQNFNAFVHRDVYCDTFFDVFWLHEAQRAEMNTYIAGWKSTIEPMWNGQVYQNYPSTDDPDFANQYWGGYYPSLQMIKGKYDPHNVFQFPQSITPAQDWQETGAHADTFRHPAIDTPITPRGRAKAA